MAWQELRWGVGEGGESVFFYSQDAWTLWPPPHALSMTVATNQ